MASDNSLESFGYTQELKKALSFKDLVLFGLVFMSPVTCMIFFGLMHTVSHGHAILAYFLAFIAVAFTASAYGQMVQAFPIAGSTFSYTQRALNPKLGFLSGWMMLLDYFLLPMLVYLMSANYAHAMLPQIPAWAWVILFVVAVTITNITGINVTSTADMLLSIIMFLLIIAFLLTALNYITVGSIPISFTYIYNSHTFSFQALTAACAFAVVSFLGFDGITTLSEETTEPGNKIGLAILASCAIQTFIFIIVVYCATAVVPDYKQITNPGIAFFDIALQVGGTFLQHFCSIVFIVSGIGVCLTAQGAASRLLFAMGRDKVIPAKLFAYIHPKFKTPIYGILLMGIVGILGSFLLQFALVSELVSFGALFGFICVNLSVFVHYYLKNRSGNRSILTHLVFPFIGILVCVFILLGLSTPAKVAGLGWMALGIIYVLARCKSANPFRDKLSTLVLNEKLERVSTLSCSNSGTTKV